MTDSSAQADEYEPQRILIAGGAGFIGSHLCERLIAAGHDLIVIDNFNDFYDPALKLRNIGVVARAAAPPS